MKMYLFHIIIVIIIIIIIYCNWVLTRWQQSYTRTDKYNNTYINGTAQITVHVLLYYIILYYCQIIV
jgi:hypothetical protein